VSVHSFNFCFCPAFKIQCIVVCIVMNIGGVGWARAGVSLGRFWAVRQVRAVSCHTWHAVVKTRTVNCSYVSIWFTLMFLYFCHQGVAYSVCIQNFVKFSAKNETSTARETNEDITQYSSHLFEFSVTTPYRRRRLYALYCRLLWIRNFIDTLFYGLDDRGSRVRFPAGAGNFSLHHHVQNGSGAYTASYPMGIRGSFLGGKAAGACSWPLTSI
jgi:hypothetical protein